MEETLTRDKINIAKEYWSPNCAENHDWFEAPTYTLQQ